VTAKSNFKLYKDAELIFYNLDSIKDKSQCFIVEGEIDALSLIEAGIDNVVSVPNGANNYN
jgi:twinkle protein